MTVHDSAWLPRPSEERAGEENRRGDSVGESERRFDEAPALRSRPQATRNRERSSRITELHRSSRMLSMRKNLLSSAFVLCVTLALPHRAEAQQVVLGSSAVDAVRSKLRVSRFAAQRIAIHSPLENHLVLIVDFDDSPVALDLHRKPVRSDDYSFETVANGKHHAITPPPERTYRGDAYFMNGDGRRWRVAATLVDGELRAFLHSEGGELRCIQPLSDVVPGAEKDLHVAFRGEDVEKAPGRCALDVLSDAIGTAKSKASGNKGWLEASAKASLKLAEIAFEGDTLYYAAKGSNPTSAQADLDTLMNAITSIYEAQVGITYEITAFVLQTDGSEQYSSINADILLGQFKNFWNANEGAIHRDTVHLLTGRNIQGGTIGIAFVGVVCDLPFAYGLAQTTWSANLLDRISLSAHEIGHNWNANHCDGINDCGIMCSFINSCAGDYQVFGNSEQNAIESFRDTLNCLSTFHPPTAAPFIDTFESSALDSDLWQSNKGAAISSAAKGETSGTRSVAISLGATGTDKLLSKAIDPTALMSADLAFYVEHRGVETGESLALQFKDANGAWVDLATIVSDGVKENTFTPHVVALPPEAMYEGVKFRFKPSIDDAGDDWFVDDFQIRAASAPLGPTFDPSLPESPVVMHETGAPDVNASFTVGNSGTTGGNLAFSAGEVVDVPWLAVSTPSGNLASQATTNVDLSTTSAAAAPGINTARVRVSRTNGPPASSYDEPITLIEYPATPFTPGDTLTGTIGVASEVDACGFVALPGETLSVKLAAVTGGLKATVRVFDSSNAQLVEMKFTSKGSTSSVTLPSLGVYRLTVEGRSGSIGGYTLATSHVLPAGATAKSSKTSPTTAGGTVTATVLALPGARLGVTVAPKNSGFGPFSVGVTGPLGEVLDTSVFSSPLPDGGVLVRNLPLLPGSHTVTISGFAGTESVALTIDPMQPTSSGTTISID